MRSVQLSRAQIICFKLKMYVFTLFYQWNSGNENALNKTICIYSLIHDRNRNTVYLRERTLQSLFCRSAVHFHQDGPGVMTDHNTLTKHHKGTCKTMKNIIKSWLTQSKKKSVLSHRKTNAGKCQVKHPALQKKEVIISNMKCL